MSTYRFDRLFAPRSVALVGASERTGSLGRAIVLNLFGAGFQSPVHLINPRHRSIMGHTGVSSLSHLQAAPDLVVIASPAETVPGVVAQACRMGVGAAIVVTAGLGHGAGSLAEGTQVQARAHGLRLLGPNCLGLIVPRTKLNASFAARMPAQGHLALVSQSGAVAAGLIEWAASRAIGFSAIVSLGDQLDIDVGDCLDHFALDGETRAILLYVEAVASARKFLSAARAAARVKPVIVVKAGRAAEGAKAAATHTGALAGSDAVYDAAFRRAGLLRVGGLDELFAAAETLARLKPFNGNRLAILTNGGGVGVLAVDQLIARGGRLASLSPSTTRRLDERLPPTWSRSNPVDIIGDADAERYADALDAILEDAENDAVLVMNVATGISPSREAARAVVEHSRHHRQVRGAAKPVFAAWIGQGGEVSELFEAAQIPHYATEAEAVGGFTHLVDYSRLRDALMVMPTAIAAGPEPDVAKARAIVVAALDEGRSWLNPVEASTLLAAYGIPMATALPAANADAAADAATTLLREHAAVALKILSPDIIHKSDVGGVRLNFTSAEQVRRAAAEMMARVRATRPHATVHGVTVHPMIARSAARELIAGIADDPTFGPVIAFGCGGTAVEVIDDKALALPPLDLELARDLIDRTRISRLLGAYRDVAAADRDAVALVLVKLGRLAADLPEVREIDVNPLLADASGVIGLDARVRIAPAPAARGAIGHPRFAVRPYPSEWQRSLTLRDGTMVLARPVKPEDERLFLDFFDHLSDKDIRLRFFTHVKDRSHAFIARLTQLDYARAMAFAALDCTSGELLGVVRLHADANYEHGEYAVLIRSDLKGRGLGWAMMELMISYARAEGLRRIHGQVLAENSTMLAMCRELGFATKADPHDPGIVNVSLPLAT
jgi:acetyltransferase